MVSDIMLATSSIITQSYSCIPNLPLTNKSNRAPEVDIYLGGIPAEETQRRVYFMWTDSMDSFNSSMLPASSGRLNSIFSFLQMNNDFFPTEAFFIAKCISRDDLPLQHPPEPAEN